MIKTFFSYLFYWAGDSVSNFMDSLSSDFRETPEWVFDWLYKIYSKLMVLSADLDVDQRIWLVRKDEETEEEFQKRCFLKFGDQD